ncbi:hypothetical protein VOLCADRAFT_95711 [Volvox carteri f. nagariensis]|uniref:CSD domain-containing protein n=1 Tax=Volvox carteri f. nagariensis TaxID=3068 RepID=D8U866_VOLCA|nr:uncharacterized protein VOLCADRAFT_95711 [Volvox carteri f. nagariensis]EFJ44087.1 hypothetical protein VOLCADRAFT_95711 [Volvox carteri f. nagariensis]|eukprot:XP_002954888.1 hypothetical protein VOLCADRAFT_95711 [Volvox carteri f. nagariensis]
MDTCAVVEHGIVAKLRRSFGFIACPHRVHDVFFHESSLEDCSLEQFSEGTAVTFILEHVNGGKPVATRVRLAPIGTRTQLTQLEPGTYFGRADLSTSAGAGISAKLLQGPSQSGAAGAGAAAAAANTPVTTAPNYLPKGQFVFFRICTDTRAAQMAQEAAARGSTAKPVKRLAYQRAVEVRPVDRAKLAASARPWLQRQAALLEVLEEAVQTLPVDVLCAAKVQPRSASRLRSVEQKPLNALRRTAEERGRYEPAMYSAKSSRLAQSPNKDVARACFRYVPVTRGLAPDAALIGSAWRRRAPERRPPPAWRQGETARAREGVGSGGGAEAPAPGTTPLGPIPPVPCRVARVGHILRHYRVIACERVWVWVWVWVWVGLWCGDDLEWELMQPPQHVTWGVILVRLHIHVQLLCCNRLTPWSIWLVSKDDDLEMAAVIHPAASLISPIVPGQTARQA